MSLLEIERTAIATGDMVDTVKAWRDIRKAIKRHKDAKGERHIPTALLVRLQFLDDRLMRIAETLA